MRHREFREMHLVVLVHGLFGNPGHLNAMENSIYKLMPPALANEVHVHRASCLSPIATFDGISDNAELVYAEIKKLLSELEVDKISLVGYSMGGLICRYVIGMFEQERLFSKVEPVLFATFATPHLGSRNTTPTLFAKAFNLLGPIISGKTGLDLFRVTPVLSIMSDPKSTFYVGLQRFKYLYIFANASKDRTVPFWTAFMVPTNPFSEPDLVEWKTYQRFPFIVDLQNSRPVTNANPKSWWKRLRVSRSSVILAFLIPVFLFVLTILMIVVSTISWTKRLLKWRHRKGKATQDFVGDIGEALNETLQMRKQGKEPRFNVELENKVPKPAEYAGIVGALKSLKPNLKLSSGEMENMEALNRLPWRKYAVWLHSLNTHGEIVDRMGISKDGRKLMDFFAEYVFLNAATDGK